MALLLAAPWLCAAYGYIFFKVMASKSILWSLLYLPFHVTLLLYLSNSISHHGQRSHKITKPPPSTGIWGSNPIKTPFCYILYSYWGIKFGLSAPLRAAHSHSRPRTPSSEQAAAPRDCTRAAPSKLTWSAPAHTGCWGFGKWKARPRMPPALIVISLRGPFSKPEIHGSQKMERHPSHPEQYVYWRFTSFPPSVLCNWSSSILWPSWSHFPAIFPFLELKYFFCAFNPIIPIYNPLNHPVRCFPHWSLCIPLLLNSLLNYLNYHFILFLFLSISCSYFFYCSELPVLVTSGLVLRCRL